MVYQNINGSLRKTILILILLILVLSVSKNVEAHATPIFYHPESSSIVEEFPGSVSIEFSERVEQRASGIRVLGPNGERIDGAVIDSTNKKLFGVNVQNAGIGTYTVAWQVVSADDGHFSKGAFTFSLKEVTKTEQLTQVQVQHLIAWPEAKVIWIELLGLSMLLGTLFLLIFLFKNLGLSSEFYKKRFTQIMFLGFFFAVLGGSLFLILKTLDLQQLNSLGFAETFKMFASTTAGKQVLLRMCLVMLLFTIFFVNKKMILSSQKTTKIEVVLFAFMLLTIFSRALISHATASSFLPEISIIMMLLHLIFKLLWAGAVITTVFLFIPLVKKEQDAVPVKKYSLKLANILTMAVCGTIVTGSFVVWLHLKDFSNLLVSEWGTRFMFLLLIGTILLLARLYHHLLVNPSFEKNGVRRFNKVLILEMFLMILLLFSSCMLSITTPPFFNEEFTFPRVAYSNGARISLENYQVNTDNFLISVDSNAKAAGVIVELSNHGKGIGPIYPKVTRKTGSTFTFSKSSLSTSGDWQIKVTAKQESEYDSVARFTVSDTANLNKTKIHNFSTFDKTILVIIILTLIASLLLFSFNKKLGDEDKTSIYPGNEDWTFAIILFLVMLLVTFLFFNFAIKSDFQRACEKNDHFWIQSVPVYNGEVMSPSTYTGCTLDVGLYHFVIPEEYYFFTRPVRSFVEMETENTITAGKPSKMNFTIKDMETSRLFAFEDNEEKLAKDLTIEHDRIMHAIIISKDLQTIGHVHPEDLGVITQDMKNKATFPIEYTFPRAGGYAVLIDYVIRNKVFTAGFFVSAVGGTQMGRAEERVPKDYTSQESAFDGYTVKFRTSKEAKVDKPLRLYYTIEKDEAPVTDLQPYLAATMHLSIIKDNLRDFTHTHGEIYLPGSQYIQKIVENYVNYHSHFVPDQFGPHIEVPITFKKRGIYKIFGEFKHNNKIVVTEFLVEVR